jgi:uncharacterized membrane protein YsdA (DUF1294 family)
MNNFAFALYFICINIISGIVFAYDKSAAIRKRQRVPETTLHFLELLGGTFANLLLIYTLRHKNRKFSYWVWTWILGIGWVIIYSSHCFIK